MNNIRLSICIPTYNRADYIKETLDSVLSQMHSSVEIVISDNGSEDNTTEIISEYQKVFKKITYFQFKNNVGYDRNFLKLMELAAGDFCWVLSSDDLLENGAITELLQRIEEFPNAAGFSVNGRGFSKDMKSELQKTTVMNFKNLREDKLFNSAEQAFSDLGDYFGFISGQIINRKKIIEVIKSKPIVQYLTSYIHVYLIAYMLLSTPQWVYISKPYVKWRSGNDSLGVLGRVRRLSIDVLGFERIAGDVYGRKSETYKVVQKRICKVIVCASVMGTKESKEFSFSYFFKIIKLCTPIYWRYAVFWLRLMPICFLPFAMLVFIKSFLHKNKLKT